MPDTIFALSSGAPPAAIAVMRISGPAAFAAVASLAGGLPAPRRASLRTLRSEGLVLDRALVLTFPGPDSATGEDLAELHLHGGRAVVRAVEEVLSNIDGLRAAEAGEFTRRALTHGRIDLTEAEGLADLLSAETEAQRRAAFRATEGGIRAMVEGWADRTLRLSAQLEAQLDHSDEDDVAGADTLIIEHAEALALDIRHVTDRPTVDRLHDGLRVVLAGAPNAGKSTLLNALVEREAAIVSPLAGTTRDRIEAAVMRAGIAYLLVDTAGLHDEPTDIVERIGIERARQSLSNADIVLWLDDSAPPSLAAPYIWINPRCDLPGRLDAPNRLSVSAPRGIGVSGLWQAIHALAIELLPPQDQAALNARQRELAMNAASALERLAMEQDPLLQAECLNAALRQFHRITGAADVEAMLDQLFGRFCIGK